MTEKLGALIEQAIEQESLATSVDSIEGRRCSSDRNDGTEYRIEGDFLEIRPIVETIADEPYVIEEFNVAFDEAEPHMNVFVVPEDETNQSSLTTAAWLQ